MAILPVKKVYQVRITTSEGNSKCLVEAASTMGAFQQILRNYSPKAALYSLSAQPYRGHNAECIAA